MCNSAFPCVFVSIQSGFLVSWECGSIIELYVPTERPTDCTHIVLARTKIVKEQKKDQ